jgi:hypothetical protein
MLEGFQNNMAANDLEDKLERSHPSNMPWLSSGQLDGEKEYESLDL